MAAFGIHELRKQTEEEFPEATYDEVFGGTRDKVVSAVNDANIPERVGEQASKLRLPEMRRPEGARGARRAEAPTATMPVSEEDARLATSRKDSASCARRASSPKRSSPPRRLGSSTATRVPQACA